MQKSDRVVLDFGNELQNFFCDQMKATRLRCKLELSLCPRLFHRLKSAFCKTVPTIREAKLTGETPTLITLTDPLRQAESL